MSKYKCKYSTPLPTVSFREKQFDQRKGNNSVSKIHFQIWLDRNGLFPRSSSYLLWKYQKLTESSASLFLRAYHTGVECQLCLPEGKNWWGCPICQSNLSMCFFLFWDNWRKFEPLCPRKMTAILSIIFANCLYFIIPQMKNTGHQCFVNLSEIFQDCGVFWRQWSNNCSLGQGRGPIRYFLLSLLATIYCH